MADRVWMAISVVAAVLMIAYFVFQGPTQAEAEEIAQSWFTALVEHDYQSLAKVDLHAPPERQGAGFDAWSSTVETRLALYEDARDSGHFETDDLGYAIARATLVGGGTFWETVLFERSRHTPVLTIRLNFGYGEIYYGDLPRGTTVYLLGYPLGSVRPIVLGGGNSLEMDVLEHLDLRVFFMRAEQAGDGDSRYKVERVEWIPESAQHQVVNWYF